MKIGVEINKTEMEKQMQLLNDRIDHILKMADKDEVLVPASELFKDIIIFDGVHKDFGILITKEELS